MFPQRGLVITRPVVFTLSTALHHPVVVLCAERPLASLTRMRGIWYVADEASGFVGHGRSGSRALSLGHGPAGRSNTRCGRRDRPPH
eukprot:1434534-Pyramimonas_sp.AAC.1